MPPTFDLKLDRYRVQEPVVEHHAVRRLKLAKGFDDNDDQNSKELQHLSIGLRGEYNEFRTKIRMPVAKQLPSMYTKPKKALEDQLEELLDIKTICEGIDGSGDDLAAIVQPRRRENVIGEWELIELALFVKDKECLVRGCIEADEARAWGKIRAGLHSVVSSHMQRLWADLHIEERRARLRVEDERVAWEGDIYTMLQEMLQEELADAEAKHGQLSPRSRQRTKEERQAQTKLELGLRQTIASLRAKNEDLTNQLGDVNVRENNQLRDRLRLAEATIVELREENRILRSAAPVATSPSPRASPAHRAHPRALAPVATQPRASFEFAFKVEG